MWFIGVKLMWLPVQGYVPISVNFLEFIKHLIIPGVCVGFPQAAFIARMTRSSMLDVIKQDYIRTAKAKGLKMRIIIIKHAFTNAVLPVITIIGMIFAILMGGMIIIETIFNIPGMGSLFATAVQKRDYPIVQAEVLFMGLIFVTANLIIDILYGYLDPRIKYN